MGVHPGRRGPTVEIIIIDGERTVAFNGLASAGSAVILVEEGAAAQAEARLEALANAFAPFRYVRSPDDPSLILDGAGTISIIVTPSGEDLFIDVYGPTVAL